MVPEIAAAPFPPQIVERDDGWFEVKIGDGALGPFPSRRFAETVAALAGEAVSP